MAKLSHLPEKVGLPFLAGPEKAQVPFQIPEGYFDDLRSPQRDNVEQQKNILPTSSINCFEHDADYFDSIAENLLVQIQGETKRTGSLLNGKSLGCPYEVPQGYFEGLHLSMTKDKEKQTLKKEKRGFPILHLRWMAAASVIVFMLGATYFLFSGKSRSDKFNVLASNDLGKTIQNIPEDDLVKYLKGEYLIYNPELLPLDEQVAPDLNQEVQTLPEDELDQYLNEQMVGQASPKGI